MAIENKYKAKDAELFAEVQKIKDGTSQNYNRLYELSEKYIYKIINDIVKNHHTTEDLMQEAYIQIYNKLDTLQEAKAFYVWAGRIATNLTLRYIQKSSKEVLVTADEEGETTFIFDKAADDTEEFIPEAVLVDKEKQRLLAEIIDNLSTEQKFCVQYFYYEEMSVNEIAELMGCSAGTVKSRLNYARKSIKDAVIELDVKHGTRLYSLSALPLFWIIFREGLELLVLSGSAVGAAATVGAASAAEATGGAGMASAAGGASSVQSASAAGGASKAAEGFAKIFETVKTKTIEYAKALVNDVKSSVNPAKEVIKGEKEIITLAASEGKKEALKATGQSLINIGKAAGKGFMAWETSSKVITIVIALIIVGNVGSNIIPDAPKKEKKPKKEVVEVQEEQEESKDEQEVFFYDEEETEIYDPLDLSEEERQQQEELKKQEEEATRLEAEKAAAEMRELREQEELDLKREEYEKGVLGWLAEAQGESATISEEYDFFEDIFYPTVYIAQLVEGYDLYDYIEGKCMIVDPQQTEADGKSYYIFTPEGYPEGMKVGVYAYRKDKARDGFQAELYNLQESGWAYGLYYGEYNGNVREGQGTLYYLQTVIDEDGEIKEQTIWSYSGTWAGDVPQGSGHWEMSLITKDHLETIQETADFNANGGKLSGEVAVTIVDKGDDMVSGSYTIADGAYEQVGYDDYVLKKHVEEDEFVYGKCYNTMGKCVLLFVMREDDVHLGQLEQGYHYSLGFEYKSNW